MLLKTKRIWLLYIANAGIVIAASALAAFLTLAIVSWPSRYYGGLGVVAGGMLYASPGLLFYWLMTSAQLSANEVHFKELVGLAVFSSGFVGLLVAGLFKQVSILGIFVGSGVLTAVLHYLFLHLDTLKKWYLVMISRNKEHA